LHLGGHSRVRRQRFSSAHPHAGKVLDVVRRDLARIRVETTGRGSDQHRRVMDRLLQKYRGWTFDDLRPGSWPRGETPLPHRTTITESFDTSDGDTLGPDLSWTEVSGDFDIVTNAAEIVGGGQHRARADSDLSSDDHYAQVEFPDGPSGGSRSGGGVICRKDSTATLTYYNVTTDENGANDDWFTYKWVAGSQTALGLKSTTDIQAGDVFKLECDGSTITRYLNGGAQNSTTDTAVSGNVRTGLHGFRNSGNQGMRLDAFEAADLAAGATLTAEPGSYTLSGTAATLSRQVTITAASGSYTLSGSAASLLHGRGLDAEGGSYTLSGTDASLFAGERLAAEAGSYSLSGTTASLLHHRRLQAGGGSYSLAAEPASLERGLELAAGGGTYGLSGTAANLLHGRRLAAEPGSYAVTGTLAGLIRGLVLAAESGTYAVSGTAATLAISVTTVVPTADSLEGAARAMRFEGAVQRARFDGRVMSATCEGATRRV
jgi:hypothetical protein